jgi:argininosuccinate lyase
VSTQRGEMKQLEYIRIAENILACDPNFRSTHSKLAKAYLDLLSKHETLDEVTRVVWSQFQAGMPMEIQRLGDTLEKLDSRSRKRRGR